MDDHFSETLELQKRAEVSARSNLLHGVYLNLSENSLSPILNEIDCFVSQSRGNKSVKGVRFNLLALDGHEDDEDVWDKVGQAV
jgi:hypothetical protein